jgi:hypothetical protein
MPLLDHFHAPLKDERHWEAFHSRWAGALADALNEVLPKNYVAEEHTHSSNRVEIDVATFEKASSSPLAGSNGGGAVGVASEVWAPPAPALVLPSVFPEDFEVLVFSTRGGPTLVAAIELVSPRNKDRSASRRAFAVKCANLLHQGISLITVDIVTERLANLHNETMSIMEADAKYFLPPEVALYAVAYRPIIRGEKEEIEVWPMPLAVGGVLPVLPLAINAELVLPVDFETTYADVCQKRRLI